MCGCPASHQTFRPLTDARCFGHFVVERRFSKPLHRTIRTPKGILPCPFVRVVSAQFSKHCSPSYVDRSMGLVSHNLVLIDGRRQVREEAPRGIAVVYHTVLGARILRSDKQPPNAKPQCGITGNGPGYVIVFSVPHVRCCSNRPFASTSTSCLDVQRYHYVLVAKALHASTLCARPQCRILVCVAQQPHYAHAPSWPRRPLVGL